MIILVIFLIVVGIVLFLYYRINYYLNEDEKSKELDEYESNESVSTKASTISKIDHTNQYNIKQVPIVVPPHQPYSNPAPNGYYYGPRYTNTVQKDTQSDNTLSSPNIDR